MGFQCNKKITEVVNYLLAQEPSILFNILNRLPKMGVGRQVTRNTWSIQDKDNLVRPAYWTITKVIPNKVSYHQNGGGYVSVAVSMCIINEL